MDPITIAFFGISGSGKGTQADLLERFLKTYSLPDGSMREVLRAEMGQFARTFMKSDSQLAKRAGEIVSSGGLLPSFVPIYLLVEYFVKQNVKGDEHFIFDGTFRKPFQSLIGDEIAAFYDRKIRHSIVLDLSKDAAKKRLVARGRHDDATEDALNRRFAWYEEDVVPAIKTLEEKGWTTVHINGDQAVEEVHKHILSALGLS